MSKYLITTSDKEAHLVAESLNKCGLFYNPSLQKFECVPESFNSSLWYDYFCNPAKNGSRKARICINIFFEISKTNV